MEGISVKYLACITVLITNIIPVQCSRKSSGALQKARNIDYGVVLSSIESHHIKKLYGMKRLALSRDVANTRAPPRCTTDEPIRLPPGFVLSSSGEADRNDIKKDEKTITMDPEGSSQPKNKYIAPAKGKKPDHYIDDI